MSSNLLNGILFVGIVVGVILGGTTLSNYFKEEKELKASETIIKTMAKECQRIKRREGFPDTIEGATYGIDVMLRDGKGNLDQRSYLLLISLCALPGGEVI